MFSPSFRLLLVIAACSIAGLVPAVAATPRKNAKAAAAEVNHDAYRSAIVLDAATGRVLFEDNADVQNPPASVTKLMTFAVVEDRIKSADLSLQTPVLVSAAASHIGGSRVYLKQGETFAVEDLLFALMVQSANDAAYALAEKVAGSRDAFVDLMNAKAKALGMTHTEFHSPHGLPPGQRQRPDLSTARDLATLCRSLLQGTDILRYTSMRTRDFRPGPRHIMMVNHNHLLGHEDGCDGFKTGWYAEAGYSLAATIQRNGGRIITVILGSPERKLRDITTTRLIEKGFAALAALPAPRPVAAPSQPAAASGNPAAGTPVQPAAQPVAAAPSPPLKLVPLKPEEQNQSLDGKTESAPAVHVDLSGTKK